ncbi:hypothetical protein ACFY8K_30495 [Streptomyces misionensis]|uniref:hypothetical protein n=1 Tax=Streptomyces misionensis TaxID=67331 RepID=UPI0036D1A180
MTDEQTPHEASPLASRKEVHNKIEDGDFHGPVIQAGIVHGGVHTYSHPPRWRPSKKQVWRAARITATVLVLAVVATYVTKRALDDRKFSSPPYVCGTIWQNPNFRRWVPDAKEGGPPEIGPEITSCSWTSRSQKAEVSIIVSRKGDRGEAAELLEKIKKGYDVQSGQTLFHRYEPGIGDDATVGTSIPSTQDILSDKEIRQISRLDFRRYNVVVELRRVMDPGESTGESDSILREMAFVIDKQLKN